LGDEQKTPIPDNDKPKAKSNKFKYYVVFMIAIILFFNAYSPAKEYLAGVAETIENLGWYGSILSTLFCGCLVIPLALPYYVIETALGYTLKSFYQPFVIGSLSKFIGCSLCYFIAKNWFRERFIKHFEDYKIYRGITIMLERSPWKFSFIFRISLMPYFIKNYGLAIPNSVTYLMYIVPATLTGAILTAMNVHLTQTAKDISQYASSENPAEQNVSLPNMIMSLLSITLMIYVGRYTYRIMKDLDNEPKGVKQEKNGLDCVKLFLL